MGELHVHVHVDEPSQQHYQQPGRRLLSHDPVDIDIDEQPARPQHVDHGITLMALDAWGRRLEELFMTTKSELTQMLTQLAVSVAQTAASVDVLKANQTSQLAAKDEAIKALQAQLAAASQSATQVADDIVQGVAGVVSAVSALQTHISTAAPAPAPPPADPAKPDAPVVVGKS